MLEVVSVVEKMRENHLKQRYNLGVWSRLDLIGKLFDFLSFCN